MFSRIKAHFKAHPSFYYAMSIAATWAGGNSLIVGMSTAQNNGIVPFALWMLGNTLACIVFGIFALRIPKLGDVMDHPVMKIILGLMCIFQIWVQMNGMQEILAGLGSVAPWVTKAVPITVAAAFILILLKDSIIRNILTDHGGWSIIYGILFLTTIIAFVSSGGQYNALQSGYSAAGLADGIKKAVLLLPGPFMYPVFWKYIRYNVHTDAHVKQVNMRRCFIGGGLLFGFYLLFVFALSWVHFSPVLNVIKAILVILIASSTLSSSMYGLFCAVGYKVGVAASIGTVALWQLLIPLGVMGAWTLMSSIRIYIVIAAIIAALVWNAVEKRKAVGA